MSDYGFIKFFRKMTEWEWYTDGNTYRVFTHLLLTANYKETNYKGVTIYPGQTVTGRKALADALHISERNVRTALKHLKSTNEITIETTSKFSVVTVVNWELYQCHLGEVTNESTNELTNNRPASDQQVTTPKEYKKENKERNNISSNKLPDEFDELWEMYPRKEGKKKAKDAYIRARKNGTSFEDVMNGIRNYQNHIEQTGIDRKYIKMGSTYFNGRCWEDRFETSDPVDDWLERWGNDEE